MKKILRLTESELTGLVRRVIDEVKSLLDDYIRFMKEERGVEKVKVPKY